MRYIPIGRAWYTGSLNILLLEHPPQAMRQGKGRLRNQLLLHYFRIYSDTLKKRYKSFLLLHLS